MNNENPRRIGLLLASAVLALAGCGSPAGVMGQMDGGTGGTGGSTSDGGVDGGGDGGVVRTATTRALLPTAVNNLLLDPFATADTSLGHFVGVLLPVVGGNYQDIVPTRSFVSQAPAGVAGPVAIVAPLSTVPNPPAPATGGRILAPFPGGTAPYSAQVWVSASDATGAPVPFATGGKGITVSLLPNDMSQPAYPLTTSGAPLEIAGREWVLLALATPVPMTQGGWFMIAIDDVSASFQLQAPQVTPAAGAFMQPPPTAPRTERDRVAVEAYAELAHRPRRRPR